MIRSKFSPSVRVNCSFGGLFATAASLVLAACGGDSNNAGSNPPIPPSQVAVSCTDIATLSIPASAIGLPSTGAVITSATLVPAGGTAPKTYGEYCDVSAKIQPVDQTASPIMMRIVMPTNWNQRAMMVGGGGLDGAVPSTITGDSTYIGDTTKPDPLGQGFAVFASDSGHEADPTNPGSFALNTEEYDNYAHDALKKTRDAAMYLINKHYAANPTFSYYFGGSTGGREGFWLAQNYPKDFQGMLILYPAYLAETLDLQMGRIMRAMAQPGAYANQAKRARLLKASMQACDALDGVVDNVVSNTTACNAIFDPATATVDGQPLRCAGGADTGDSCLSDAQIAALKVMATPLTISYPMVSAETQYPGYNVWGSDTGLAGAGIEAVVTSLSLGTVQPAYPVPAGAPFMNAFWDQFVKYFVTKDPNYDSLTFDPENPPTQNLQRLSDLSARMDVNQSLASFQAAGGKMLIVHGMADTLVSVHSTEQYWLRLQRDMGVAQVNSFARFYEVPGFGHGFSTLFQPSFDAIGPLEAWAECSTAPSLLVMTDTTGFPGRTRPLCEYPTWPKYSGSGDVNGASNYTCATQ